jgi:hypothetical protein
MRKGGVERRQRVDGVAEPGVLEHHHRPPPRQVGTGGDGHGVALVGRADVVQLGRVEGVVDERLEVRAGHPREEAKAPLSGLVHEAGCLDHGRLRMNGWGNTDPGRSVEEDAGHVSAAAAFDQQRLVGGCVRGAGGQVALLGLLQHGAWFFHKVRVG